MGNLHDLTLSAPHFQLDPEHLDIVELVLGGLLDASALEEGLPLWQDSTLSESDAGHVVLADPDGTGLALLSYQRQSLPADDLHRITITDIQALARAEHGVFRSLRLTRGLGDQPVVFFDRAPQPSDIADLKRREDLPAGLRFVLVARSSQCLDPGYVQTMEQLQAAALLFAGAQCGHLVLPDTCEAAPVLAKLSTRPVAEFFSPRSPADDPASAGVVILFSGLSGSGKSTLARAVQERIHHQLPQRAVLLDGDDIRRFISKGLGFSRQDRETNVERIGWIAARIAEVGGIALCAPIAPFAATRSAVRQLAAPVGRFVLVHVSTPLAVCEQRDRKGLYAKARAGLVTDFTGIDSPYEVPLDADLSVDLSRLSIPEATAQVIGLLQP